MIEINLLPEEMRKREPVKLALPEVPIKKTLIVSIAVIFGIQALLVISAVSLHWRVGWLKGEIDTLQKGGSEVAAQKTETLALQERMKQLRAATSRKFYWAKLLEALTASTTRGVWLRTLSIKNEETAAAPVAASGDKKTEEEKKAKPVLTRVLVLQGSAVGAGQETAFIGKYLQALKDNPFFSDIFSDIRLSDIQQRRIEQVDAYDFMIVCKFKKDKS